MDITGVYVPVVTPFDARDRIDEAAYAGVVEHCIAAGVEGIIPAGTTGEYYALSEAERGRVYELVREVTAGRARLLAGANAGSTAEVIRHGQRARELGYDGLMLACPHTSLPTQRELVGHFSAVAAAVGLPIVLYNFPARAGVEIGIDALEQLAEVPEIVALKESSGDFSRFLAIRDRLGARLQVACGSDDQALDYLRWGVRSWIAGTANVLPAAHVEVVEAALRGDWEEAVRVMRALLPWIQLMEAGSYNQKAKLGLELVGVRAGAVRQPLLPLAEDEAAAYAAMLERARRSLAVWAPAD